jgi:lipopolysaccharide export system protein LptA
MTIRRIRTCAAVLLAAGAAGALGAIGTAHAEHGDRAQQISITAADAQADHLQQTAEFHGDVVVTQGSLEIHADRVTLRPGANGERLGFAWGKAGAPVRFRQRGDRADEWSEGQAERVEYDSIANEVRLIGAASLRNLDGRVVTQAMSGPTITYDTAHDTVSSTEADHRALLADASPTLRRVSIVFAPRITPAP